MSFPTTTVKTIISLNEPNIQLPTDAQNKTPGFTSLAYPPSHAQLTTTVSPITSPGSPTEFPVYIIFSGLLFLLLIAIFAVYRLVKKALLCRLLRKEFVDLTELDVNGLDRASIKSLLRHHFPRETYIPWKSLTVGESCVKGCFSETWKGCVLRSNVEPKFDVAIKCLYSDNNNLKALKEANFMKGFSGLKHILELYGIAVSEKGNICIITEFMPNGSLHSYMNQHTCSANDKLRFCKEIASGLVFIHFKNVLHLDLAARNCMVDHRKQIKITDFGQSRKFTDYMSAVHLERMAAAFRWMPIEFFDDQPISTKGDIWSYGVTAWEIFTDCRQKPYAYVNDFLCYKYLKDGHRLEQPEGCDDAVFAMIASCWRERREKRPAAEQLLDFFGQLVHQSIVTIDIEPETN